MRRVTKNRKGLSRERAWRREAPLFICTIRCIICTRHDRGFTVEIGALGEGWCVWRITSLGVVGLYILATRFRRLPALAAHLPKTEGGWAPITTVLPSLINHVNTTGVPVAGNFGFAERNVF